MTVASVQVAAAYEKDTYAIKTDFFDEDGDPMTPNTVLWTLTDLDGDIINSREDVNETPATSVNIVLKGDDLQIKPDEESSVERIVTVSGTFNSDLGTNLPYNRSTRIIVKDLKGVS